jgi:hypothetical protein
MAKSFSGDNHPVVFQMKDIRRVWHEGEWWFSVVDVVGVLTNSADPRNYWKILKKRLLEQDGAGQTVTECNQLKLPAADGKLRETDCAPTEIMLRIIQSIPSPRAEPFKLWLAKAGHARLKEIENPALAAARSRALYKAKGYTDSWIDKNLRSLEIREELAGEWRRRGIEGPEDYAQLAADIAEATFGLAPDAHKKLKGLKDESANLRDHLTELELIFTMLGEASTAEIARAEDAQGIEGNRKAAQSGGKIAGAARRELEKKTGRPITSAARPVAAKRISGKAKA